MSKFSEAFKQARKNKKGIFKFNGKYYSTRIKGEDIDNFRRNHKDYDAYIGGATSGPNWHTDNWKTTDKTIDLINKINHVPDPITIQPALEKFNPFGKYNFTELDIRNFGSVRNIYNAYLNSFNSPYNKDSYIGFLRDYFGNRFNGNLNENDFNKAMLEDFGMRGNIRGNDYKQGFGAFQGWLTAQKEKYLNNKNVPQNNIEPNSGGTDTRSQVVPGRVYGHKNGGIMYKYLLGGQMDPQLILTLVAGMLALDLGGTEQDAAQIMQSPEEFDNALSLVLSNMTGQDVTVDDNNRDLAIAEYVKAKLEQQVQTAKEGTKLDYLKSLRGNSSKEVSNSKVEYLHQDLSWVNELIEKLKVAFCEEMNAWYSYTITKPFLAGGERKEIAETYEELGKDEYEDHAMWLLERLNLLNADVNDISSPDDWAKKTTKHPYRVPTFDDGNICSTCNLQDLIKNELDAIETYQDLVSFTEGKDPVSHRKLKEILADEEEHYQELKEHLTDIEFNSKSSMKNPEASKFILAIARNKKGGKLDRLSKIKISACGSKMKKNKKK